MLRDPEAVVDRRVPGARVQPRRGADLRRGHPRDGLRRLRRVLRIADEGQPAVVLGVIAAGAGVIFLVEPLGDHHVRERVEHGDVGARAELEVMGGLDVRQLDQIDPARIDDNELRPLPQAPLHLRGEDGVAVGGVRAHDDDDVSF